jgi:arsenate reductase
VLQNHDDRHVADIPAHPMVRWLGSALVSTDEPIVIFHNPSCSKSRQALELLEERGVEPEVVKYKDHPLDRATIERIVALVPNDPADLVRAGDARKAGLDPADYVTAEAVTELLVEQGGLMERPVVLRGDRAVIGRPTEAVESLLD